MIEPHIELERRWAEWNRLDPAGMVACSSGTAALHLALETLIAVGDVPSCSRVLCPELTMIAIPRAVVLASCEPEFVDCDSTLNMQTPDIGPGTGASIAVHTYGRMLDMGRMHDANLLPPVPVIEDLAEAHGIAPHASSIAACWSFYRNKIVHGEEGGAVWFKDASYARIARQLRSLGFTDAHDFIHIPRGHNYRMSNAHATLILNNLPQANANITERWRQLQQLDTACPDEWLMPSRQAPWVYDLRIPGMTPVQQDKVVAGLNAIGITARHCFKPCTMQEEFRECLSYPDMSPNAYAASREVIYIGLQPGRPRIDQIVFREIRRILS